MPLEMVYDNVMQDDEFDECRSCGIRARKDVLVQDPSEDRESLTYCLPCAKAVIRWRNQSQK